MTAQQGAQAEIITSALGEELFQRREPDLTSAFVAAGGAAVGAGLVGMGVINYLDDGEGRAIAFILSILAVAAGYGALALWKWGDVSVIRPAAIALVSAGILGFIFSAFTTSESAELPFIVMALLFAGAWFAPFTRGRPWLLGMALFALVVTILTATTDGGSLSLDLDDQAGSVTEFGAVAIILGLLLLVVMHLLDRRGWHGGLASPFAAVGSGTFILGLLSVLGSLDSAAGTGTLALIAGVVLVWFGSSGQARRLTTWLGAVAVFVGIFSWVVAIYDGGSVWIPGILLMVFGAIVIGAALVFSDPAKSAKIMSFFQGDGSVAETPASTYPTATIDQSAASAPGAAWHPDPAGRNQERWWDGTAWSSHVRNNGVDAQDPL